MNSRRRLNLRNRAFSIVGFVVFLLSVVVLASGYVLSVYSAELAAARVELADFEANWQRQMDAEMEMVDIDDGIDEVFLVADIASVEVDHDAGIMTGNGGAEEFVPAPVSEPIEPGTRNEPGTTEFVPDGYVSTDRPAKSLSIAASPEWHALNGQCASIGVEQSRSAAVYKCASLALALVLALVSVRNSEYIAHWFSLHYQLWRIRELYRYLRSRISDPVLLGRWLFSASLMVTLLMFLCMYVALDGPALARPLEPYTTLGLLLLALKSPLWWGTAHFNRRAWRGHQKNELRNLASRTFLVLDILTCVPQVFIVMILISLR